MFISLAVDDITQKRPRAPLTTHKDTAASQKEEELSPTSPTNTQKRDEQLFHFGEREEKEGKKGGRGKEREGKAEESE